jgi:putative transposase
MSTYTQICYHIVFAANERKSALTEDRRRDLFHYIWRIVKKRRSRLYRINGTLDHIHTLWNLHPSQSFADFVKNIKGGSSFWIKENDVFPEFTGWQRGYGAFTHTSKDVDSLTEYIKKQDDFHKSVSSKDEMRNLLIGRGGRIRRKILCLIEDGFLKSSPRPTCFFPTVLLLAASCVCA